MGSIIGPFDAFSSEIYDSKISKIAGACEHKTLRFAEKFALKLLKTYDSVRFGAHANEKEFRKKLFSERHFESPDVDFTLDLSAEDAYTELLLKEGIISDRATFIDKASLAAKAVQNSIFLATTVPISLTAGAAALGLRYYVQGHMHSITCLNTLEFKIWDEDEPLRIFTSNAALTEFQIMDYLNGVSDTKVRAKEWGRKLSRIDADVICLQEAFDVDALYPVAKDLNALAWSVGMVAKRKQVFGMTGGLLIASRYEITKIGFHEYTDLRGIDKRTRKGVLAIVVRLNKMASICIATTHMQAGFPSGTEEEHIEWRTQEFHQARHFLNRFITHTNVRDVFFVGDFNCSRFDRGGQLDQAVTNGSYPAIVNGLLRPIFYQEGFKDLTVPDRAVDFENSLFKQTHFDHHDPKSNESGQARGSCCDTSAASYHYFVDIVVLEVKRRVVYSTKVVKKMVKKRLAGEDLRSKMMEEIIDCEIKQLKKTMYMKPNVVDHIALREDKENYFDATNYKSKRTVEVGPKGPLTDHASFFLKIYPI